MGDVKWGRDRRSRWQAGDATPAKVEAALRHWQQARRRHMGAVEARWWRRWRLAIERYLAGHAALRAFNAEEAWQRSVLLAGFDKGRFMVWRSLTNEQILDDLCAVIGVVET